MHKIQFYKKKKSLLMLVGFSCCVPAVWAGNNFSINKYVIANGGGTSSAGSYQVQGTIAQVTTGQSTGNSYQVNSGYWQAVDSSNDIIFKDGFE
jgi:hypothetical protein